jgi:nitrilase
MVSTPDLERNLAAAAELIAAAAAAGAKLVLLPEYFCIMGRRDTDKLALRERLGQGPIQAFLAAQARMHGLWVIGGTLPLAPGSDEADHSAGAHRDGEPGLPRQTDAGAAGGDPARVLNTTLVFDPQGEPVARYDKIHLFNFQKGDDSFDEARTIQPGARIVSFAAPFGRVGLSVCYDLRFPELYRQLGDCTLLVVPSAFTYATGRAHWELLLRARAVENQCYVLAAAQGGEHENGRRTWGHSMLVDPWGEIVAQRADGPGIVYGDLDPEFLADVRRSLPALTHRVLGAL